MGSVVPAAARPGAAVLAAASPTAAVSPEQRAARRALVPAAAAMAPGVAMAEVGAWTSPSSTRPWTSTPSRCPPWTPSTPSAPGSFASWPPGERGSRSRPCCSALEATSNTRRRSSQSTASALTRTRSFPQQTPMLRTISGSSTRSGGACKRPQMHCCRATSSWSCCRTSTSTPRATTRNMQSRCSRRARGKASSMGPRASR
mmetsp:Transcript_18905/g.53879  ORF Transcript_18905/g.53879 Transcript_18905/m.53879 type:complete len:202 (-) Transcript_18905:418-1023(-)